METTDLLEIFYAACSDESMSGLGYSGLCRAAGLDEEKLDAACLKEIGLTGAAILWRLRLQDKAL